MLKLAFLARFFCLANSSRKTIVFHEFVNQRQFGAFLLSLFHDKAK